MTAVWAMPDPAGPAPGRAPAPVTAAVFFSSLDRWAVGPTLVLVAVGLGVDLTWVASIAGLYYLAYGCSQPVWGVLSDRVGRVRLMRLALAVTAVAGAVAALAPDVTVLAAARVVSGVCWGGVVPTSVTYVGDTVAADRRQRALADLTAMISVGTAVAMAVGGWLGETLSWRVVVAVPAVAAVACAFAMRRVPEGVSGNPGGLLAHLAGVLTHRWVWFVYAVAFLEGAVILGLLTYLPAALATVGLGPSAAGLVTGLYGVAVLACSRVVGPAAARWPRWVLLAVGGSAMTVGLLVVSARITPVTVAVCALAFGAGWSFFHSSMQAWSTQLVPAARGTVVALFSASLFIGSAVFTAAVGPLVGAGRFGPVFASCTVAAVLLTAVAGLGSRAHLRRHPAG